MMDFSSLTIALDQFPLSNFTLEFKNLKELNEWCFKMKFVTKKLKKELKSIR